MIKYNEEEIRGILEGILGRTDFRMEPIGNHHLKRHLVYKIIYPDNSKLTFKLYYIPNRRSREIASLKALQNSSVKCPEIYKYGVVDGYEWLIITYIEGSLLDKVLPDMSEEEAVDIFLQIGEELGKLHSFKVFDFFGEWDEDGKCISEAMNYKENYIKRTEVFIQEVLNKDLPNKELLISVINEIRDNYEKLNMSIEPRLVHGDFDGRNILVIKTAEGYRVSGIIDFEICWPGNAEIDFVGLYFRYFLENKEFEKAFFKGYNKYLEINMGFYKRINLYLLRFVIANCSWAAKQAPEYYHSNIEFLKRIIKPKNSR